MKNVILILILLNLCPLVTPAQVFTSVQWYNGASSDKNDSIYYDLSKKLTWNDFRGKPNNRMEAGAITQSGFGYALSLTSSMGKTNIYITVTCYFNRAASWVKPGMRDDYGLLHEQHHFDITYLNTWRFVQKLKKAVLSLENYAGILDRLYKETNDELEKMQNDYDGQTSNGRFKNLQEVWNKKIDRELAAIITTG